MTGNDRGSIRVGVRTSSISEERLRYLKQIGVDDIYIDRSSVEEEENVAETPDEIESLVVDGDVIPTVGELQAARAKVESPGLRLAGIHSLPYST